MSEVGKGVGQGVGVGIGCCLAPFVIGALIIGGFFVLWVIGSITMNRTAEPTQPPRGVTQPYRPREARPLQPTPRPYSPR